MISVQAKTITLWFHSHCWVPENNLYILQTCTVENSVRSSTLKGIGYAILLPTLVEDDIHQEGNSYWMGK